MNRVQAVVKLHMSRRMSTWLMPPVLALGVVVAVVLVVGALRLAGIDTNSEAFVSGIRTNGAILWTLTGFLIASGVQAATSCFSLAVALGTTRRDYVAGTGVYFVLLSVYLTAILACLLLVEKATGQWFINAYAIDVFALGGGELGRFVPLALLGALAMLSLGTLFGSSWLRFGSRGPLLIAAVLVVLIVVAIFLVVPNFARVVQWLTPTFAMLALVVLTVVSLLGATGFLRTASVRRV